MKEEKSAVQVLAPAADCFMVVGESRMSPADNVAPTSTSRHHYFFWLWIMCLAGVDYFSTLGYQPSIAFEATGLLAPLATVVLVLLTLFGALPVYVFVAGKAPDGQGSIGMLERLLRGWGGKFIVLALLGFAATDFVITKTLSAADAAEHLIHNPFWEETPDWLRSQLVVTMFLLVLLGASFMRGYRDVVGLAVAIVAVYLTLNAMVIGSGLFYVLNHPDMLMAWYADVTSGNWHLEKPPLAGHDWLTIVAICLLLFPKLALGLSGFETGVLHVHLVKGRTGNEGAAPGRVRNTRKLLVLAAVIMSIYLLGSALVTSTGRLIDPADLQADGKAANRALAHLAHNEGPIEINPLFGKVFGTAYDISTIVILWFAGASAMAGLINMVPQYLPRYGMAPEWTRAYRPLVIFFTAINLLVTYVFRADVAAQAGAYATGVLVLMFSACLGTVITVWRARVATWLAGAGRRLLLGAYGAITAVFAYTLVANMIERPDGLLIASCFVITIWIASMISRTLRSTELRFMGFEFVDDQSRFLWDSLKHLEFPVLVPHRPGSRELAAKEESIRKEHHLTADIPIVFLEARLGDASDFYQSPLMEVKQEEGRFIVRLTRCASIAHVIAAVALELSKVGKPPEIHFGWSDESPLAANIGFILFGEGNVPWMVRELINRAEPDTERRPRIIIG
jgi:hypothetical protein